MIDLSVPLREPLHPRDTFAAQVRIARQRCAGVGGFAKALREHRGILDFNPFYHLLQAVRAPLMGAGVAPHTYLFLAGMAAVGWVLTFSIFAYTRRRIVHYL